VSVLSPMTFSGGFSHLIVASTSVTPTFASGFHVTAGTTTLDGPSIHNGVASFPGGITGSIHYSGSIFNFDGSVNVNGATLGIVGGVLHVDVGSRLILSLDAHATWRHVVCGDFDQNFAIADGDFFRFNTLATVDRNVKFLNAGANKGDCVEVSLKKDAGAHNLNVKRDDNTVLLTLNGSNASGSYTWCKLWHNGSDWELAGFGHVA